MFAIRQKTTIILACLLFLFTLAAGAPKAYAAFVYCNNDKNTKVTLKKLGDQTESPQNACRDKGGVYKTEEQIKEEKNIERDNEAFEQCQDAESESDQCVTRYIGVAIRILSAGVGIIVIIMIIIGGIQYSAAGGDAQKVAAAKTRIFNALLALGAYFFLAVVLQWLLPGGWL